VKKGEEFIRLGDAVAFFGLAIWRFRFE